MPKQYGKYLIKNVTGSNSNLNGIANSMYAIEPINANNIVLYKILKASKYLLLVKVAIGSL